MPFERYERTGAADVEAQRVSLRASGSIGLNHATVDSYFDEHEYAVLYYDEERGRVGIEPSNADGPDTYALQRGDKPTHGGTLYAVGFLREYDLLPEHTTKYGADWDDDAGLVAIDLTDPVAKTPTDARPDPREHHATVSWVDDVSGADTVLLVGPDGVDDRRACTDLLGVADPEQTGVVAVTHDRSADEWLAAFDDHGGVRPAELVIVDVDPSADAAHTTERRDGVTVSLVPDLGDLTGIGIPLTDHCTVVREGVDRLVVCVDSVTELLRAADDDRVLDFVEVVTTKVGDWATGQTDVQAHYNLAADAHRAETVEELERMVDVTVTLDANGEVAGTRR